ncbi:YqeG family HAD IIIA-type phosphatase [Bacillus shivajii]|uniref:YqeG family HAD IIIA-type phosphatase n=1 Tax=Bacillus shivajii TaxID=1983719 RepID=UPI001CF9DF83|nr:YqeG family HAD IIIA-type phosphatase [Bacillus shivajii]UCZ54427.1 YqeG family HAD IIIA-type phosphatase [Bacillus shivajii]
MKYFKPDFELHHFSDITKDWLEENQIETIFSDLDSTLAIHDEPGDDDLKAWIEMLKENHVTLVIVSNNSQGRVDRFCKPFNITGFGRCQKPAPSKIRKQMKSIGAKEKTSLFLGDQLLTDVWCGKLLNMKTALVTPIGREHEPIQIIIKRKIESFIKKRW